MERNINGEVVVVVSRERARASAVRPVDLKKDSRLEPRGIAFQQRRPRRRPGGKRRQLRRSPWCTWAMSRERRATVAAAGFRSTCSRCSRCFRASRRPKSLATAILFRIRPFGSQVNCCRVTFCARRCCRRSNWEVRWGRPSRACPEVPPFRNSADDEIRRAKRSQTVGSCPSRAKGSKTKKTRRLTRKRSCCWLSWWMSSWPTPGRRRAGRQRAKRADRGRRRLRGGEGSCFPWNRAWGTNRPPFCWPCWAWVCDGDGICSPGALSCAKP